jgi:hypothetical protein
MKPALIAIAALFALTALPAPASAGVYPEGTGEPAYTNSAQNTQWFRWDGTGGADGYKLDFRYYRDNAEVGNENGDVSVNGGTIWANWSGKSALEHGSQYGICAQGRYSLPNDSLFFSDGPNSCSMGTQLGRRSYTTIDRSKPAIGVVAAGGAQVTKSSTVSLHINFSDDVAGPYPGNFVCVEAGDGPACSGIYAYAPECSVPNQAGKMNSFDCQIDVSGSSIPDGPVKFCAIAADAAIPDNPNGPDQSGSPDKANLSPAACDTVVIDRTAPAPSGGGAQAGGGSPAVGASTPSFSSGAVRTGGKGISVLAPKRVKLGRRSILLGVTADNPGRLALTLLRGKSRRARSSALLKRGVSFRRLRLPKGLRPGKHVLKAVFTPKGAKRAVTLKLAITFVGAKKAKATSARTASAARARIDKSTIPAPRLPDGRLHGASSGHVMVLP